MLVSNKLLSSLLGLVAALAVSPIRAQCGSNCGDMNSWPAFAKLNFNLDNCDLKNSWLLVSCGGSWGYYCMGVRDIDYFYEGDKYGGECTGKFEWIRFHDHYLNHWNSLEVALTDPEKCDGTYSFDFDYTTDDTSGTFKDAKVLCNSDEVLALLARDPGSSRSFHLYFETIALEEVSTSYGDLSDVVPRETGMYCKAMFPLMTDLLALLKDSPNAYDNLRSACGNSDEPHDDDTNTWAIVGGVVGGVVALGLIVGLIVCLTCCRKKKSGQQLAEQPKNAVPNPVAAVTRTEEPEIAVAADSRTAATTYSYADL